MDPQQQPTETPAQPATSETTPTPVAPAPAETPKKGYGKRPIWQWVAIYVVLAVIVYSLVYYFFLRNKGTTGTGY